MSHAHRDMSPELELDNLDILLLWHLFVVQSKIRIYTIYCDMTFFIYNNSYFFPRYCCLSLRFNLNFDSIMTSNLTFVTTIHHNFANLFTHRARSKVAIMIFPFFVVTIRRLLTQLFTFRRSYRLFTSTRYKNFGRTTIARYLKKKNNNNNR